MKRNISYYFLHAGVAVLFQYAFLSFYISTFLMKFATGVCLPVFPGLQLCMLFVLRQTPDPYPTVSGERWLVRSVLSTRPNKRPPEGFRSVEASSVLLPCPKAVTTGPSFRPAFARARCAPVSPSACRGHGANWRAGTGVLQALSVASSPGNSVKG